MKLRFFCLGSLALVACLRAVGAAAAPERKMPALTLDPSAVGEAGKAPSLSSYADALEPVQRAVVTVDSRKTIPIPPRLRQMLGRLQAPDPTETGLGSGVIVSSDGYIVTNNHVVNGADADGLKVQMGDGREFAAKLIGADPKTDIAIIKIEAEGLTPITIADSDKLRVGDVVFAIGNPLAIGQTVTMGIVSAKGRNIGILKDVQGYEDFIQTDAAINMGNSGGALVDARGRLVGINSAIMTPSQGSIGIGFAVPVNLAQNIMKSLIEKGVVSWGFLGLDGEFTTPDIAASLKLKEGIRGLVVQEVFPETPAAKAGFKPYDVLLSLDGRTITSKDEFKFLVAQKSPGSNVTLKFLRDGKEDSVDVVLAARDDLAPDQILDGITVSSLTEELRRAHGIRSQIMGGLVVVAVDPKSPYADRFEEGTVILQINRLDVTDVASARRAIEMSVAGRGGKIANLMVAPRGRSPMISTLVLQETR